MSGCGFFIVAIDPDIFTPAGDFRRRVTAYAQSIRTSRPVDPAKPVVGTKHRAAGQKGTDHRYDRR
jgi:LDH2 family malate/lactate/ureidoglycolate dehydrogenase